MKRKVVYYSLNFQPKRTGRIIVLLEREANAFPLDLEPGEFMVLATILGTGGAYFDDTAKVFTVESSFPNHSIAGR